MHALTLLTATLLPAQPTIDFDTQVMPVLTRAGCNTGSCHGAASGRGGFKLSLWGSNPDADHQAIVTELEGRRVNLSHPEKSLILLKPTRELDHKGGQRFTPDSPSAKLLHQWLKHGAQRPRSRTLTRFEIKPSRHLFSKVDDSIPLRAFATFDDKSTVEVTAQTVFTSTDEGAVTVEKDGEAFVLRQGQHTVLARYLDQVVPVTLILPIGTDAIDLRKGPRHNWIDDAIYEKLATLRLPLSPPSDDATFLRRAFIDLTGSLPDPKEVKAFLADKSREKRAKLINRLLASSDFNDYWTLQWGNLLRINSRSLGKEGAETFHEWVRKQIAKNVPLDQMAKEMVLALGDGFTSGPVNFTRVSGNPREHAEHFSRVLMGVRLRCANCHNHPLDRWTQDDYHGLAAIFARLERGRVVKLTSSGEVTHPRTGEPAQPRIPGDRMLELPQKGREALAQWLTKKTNPYFPKIVVNRLWKAMMGRGLVEPVDDLRATNPATHPVLLTKLADDFVSNGYNVRHTLRLIAQSAAYQRSSQPVPGNQADDRFYSHALRKPLQPEVLADAIATVTGVSDKYGEMPLGTRAVTLPDSRIPSPALDILGRCSREDPCEATNGNGGLDKTLHLINGKLLNRKITSDKGRLHQMLSSKKVDLDIIELFYLLALSRPLTDKEKTFWKKTASSASNEKERQHLLEDFLWGLLTSRNFTSNH